MSLAEQLRWRAAAGEIPKETQNDRHIPQVRNRCAAAIMSPFAILGPRKPHAPRSLAIRRLCPSRAVVDVERQLEDSGYLGQGADFLYIFLPLLRFSHGPIGIVSAAWSFARDWRNRARRVSHESSPSAESSVSIWSALDAACRPGSVATCVGATSGSCDEQRTPRRVFEPPKTCSSPSRADCDTPKPSPRTGETPFLCARPRQARPSRRSHCLHFMHLHAGS